MTPPVGREKTQMSRLQNILTVPFAAAAVNQTASLFLASLTLLILVGVAAKAQPEAEAAARTKVKPTPSPIVVLTQDEYNQRVQAGQKFLPITPDVLAKQNQQIQTTDAQNQAIVDAFVKANPNLPGLTALVTAPTDPVLPDGNYSIKIPEGAGGAQTIELMGQGTILAGLAMSIQAASDLETQLGVYKVFYDQYSALYDKTCSPQAGKTVPGGCANLLTPSGLPNPSTLQNASLGAIKSALQTLVSQGLNIIKVIPIPAPIGMGGSVFASCSADIGASLKATQVNYGDQTGSSKCSGTPGKNGLLANFDFPGKNDLTCVKNQGGRATCHIFASISALEELIGGSTGKHVNLSEQEFNEQLKIWKGEYFKTGGTPLQDMNLAQTSSYQFAYEDQWDYNPIPKGGAASTCLVYPYPNPISGLLEPGCSDSSPESPEYCVGANCQGVCELLAKLGSLSVALTLCSFSPAVLSGPRSPYMSNGGIPIWDHKDPSLSIFKMVVALGYGYGVVLGLKETPNFHDVDSADKKAGLPPGYIVYEESDIDTPKGSGGHAVHVVAYIDNTQLESNPVTKGLPLDLKNDGGGYFVIKNSWGECYGDAGYAYMPISYLQSRASDVTLIESVGQVSK
jgi:hypothetical protein